MNGKIMRGTALALFWAWPIAAAPTLDLLISGMAPVQYQPVTFGFLFAPGDIPAGKAMSAEPASGGSLPTQVDAKARHADGSLRHAVITLIHALPGNSSEKVTLKPIDSIPAGTPVRPQDLLATGYDAVVTLTLGSTAYTASAKSSLQAAVTSGQVKSWLSGPLVSEWLVSTPFAGPGGAHPHLSARFAIRAYAGMASVRTDLTVENDWAFESNPSGFTYDVAVTVGSVNAYAKTGLAHTHHTRWRKVFWSGIAPALDAKLDRDYLTSTGAVPQYDRSVVVPASAVSALSASFEPMSNGDWTSYMPQTGSHEDIGPMPRSAALYLLTLDPKAKANVLANGVAGGSYQIHYRDKAKDLPVSLDDFAYMTLQGNPGDTRNPATGKYDSFPSVSGGLEQHTPDDSHQPSIAFLPYLISGDYFFLEELQFWANWNMILANPYYREFNKGLLKWSQVRGQAWSLRTLAHAAYLTPDNHPLKAYFAAKVKNNVDWYSQRYVGSSTMNTLGWLDAGYAIVYDPNGLAPWQDDFFTWSVAHLVDLGFADAKALLDWKAKFVVGRMTDSGYCWLKAPAYSLQIGPADKSRHYATFGELYQANYPGVACSGTAMDGYPDDAAGYGANMQPALAAAVDAGIPLAAKAWAKYQTRNPKQNYSASPQWAVIPKSEAGSSIRRAVAPPFPRGAVAPRLRLGPGGIRIQVGEGAVVRFFNLRGEAVRDGIHPEEKAAP